MPDDKLSFEQFGARIKAKHPEYADMPDGDVGRKVYAKFPQYQDMVDPNMASTPAKPQTTGATISAVNPQTTAQKVEHSVSDFIGDVQYGTGNTMLGRVLQKMGATGSRVGSQASAGDMMASPVTGTARVVKGNAIGAQPDRKWEGFKESLGGAAEALTIPSMIVTPEAAPAAASKAVDALPSATRAGKTFGEVASAANTVPVEVSQRLGNIVLEAKEMQDAGSNMPQVMRKFYARATDPNKGDITYKEARRFYQNATRMSAQETTNTNEPMMRQLAMFTDELKNVIYEAAQKVGREADLKGAMSEYASASRNADRLQQLKDVFNNYARYAVPGAAAAYTASKVYGGGR